MKRGLNSLASIAAAAPLTGFFGTAIGAMDSFKGLLTERSIDIGKRMAKDLSESLMPTALGLFVAVLAFFCYKYLLSRLETFDVEMQCGSLELIDELARLQKGARPSGNI
jgi:biopolymer transport protein ExbB/TolQ